MAARAAGAGKVLEVAETPCLEDMADIAVRHTDMVAGEVGREHERTGLFPGFAPLYRPRTKEIIMHQ